MQEITLLSCLSHSLKQGRSWLLIPMFIPWNQNAISTQWWSVFWAASQQPAYLSHGVGWCPSLHTTTDFTSSPALMGEPSQPPTVLQSCTLAFLHPHQVKGLFLMTELCVQATLSKDCPFHPQILWLGSLEANTVCIIFNGGAFLNCPNSCLVWPSLNKVC